ncbi:MAG: hypothetical protein WKG06_30075 [Segetibacter sp.]
MQEEEQLHKVLTKFMQYERPDVHDFREAIEHFKQDIPKVTVAIRDIIEVTAKNKCCIAAMHRKVFWKWLKQASILI